MSETNPTEALKIEYRTPYEQQCIITNLVAELAIVLNNKTKLENENLTLKHECQELSQKLLEYERSMKEEKETFRESFRKSEEIIKENEKSLIKKKVQCLEEQKKYLTEINTLKVCYYKHKELSEKKEGELINKIKFLKTKLEEAASGYDAVKELSDTNLKKYASYKAKMKFAMGIIHRLTAEIKECQRKPLMDDKECQTDVEDKNSRSLNHGDVKTESDILAELFFKPCAVRDELNSLLVTTNEIYENIEGNKKSKLKTKTKKKSYNISNINI